MKIPLDKQLHFIAGLVLSSFGFIHPLLFSLGFIAGITKEIYDAKTKKGNPEILDAFYTIIGSTIPCIIYLVCF
jgi:hypothetical protein